MLCLTPCPPHSYEHLSTEHRTKLAAGSAAFFVEFDGGTRARLKPDTLQSQIKVLVSLHAMTNNLAGILQATVVHLPNANHLAHVDQPAEFVATVKKGLAGG